MSLYLVRLAVIGAVVAAVFAACGNPSPASTRPSPIQSSAPRPRPCGPDAADLVGGWERQTRCAEIVAALRSRGLERLGPRRVAGFVPGATGGEDLADPTDPCAGAVPLRHSHFFTADGLFGSRDQDRNEVDDGTYRIVDERTFIVSKEFPDVTFHYAIDGNTITFDPVIPECAPGCFEAFWSVTVAYPGLPWTKVGVAEAIAAATRTLRAAQFVGWEQQHRRKAWRHRKPPGDRQASAGPVTSLDDPRASRSCSRSTGACSPRSLAYNEAFTRGGMFLTFLSTSFVALALLAQAMSFGEEFLTVAAMVLAFDLVIGLTTYGRISGANVRRPARGLRHGPHPPRLHGDRADPDAVLHDRHSRRPDVASMGAYGDPSSRGIGVILYGLTTRAG